MRKVLGVMLILLALFVGGCGLLFTGAALIDWQQGYSEAFLIFSIPSAVVGGLLLWGGRVLFRTPARPPEPGPTP